MPAIPGVISGGTLLRSPAALPGATEFVTISSTGGMDTQILTESDISDLGTYQPTSEKGQANGYASLDASGQLPAAQLPAIAVTEYLGEAANQAAMLALVGQEGDWTVRTDLGTVWIITGPDPTQLTDWTELSYPTAPVQSVAGKTGVVVLAAGDIASDTFADARIAESNVTQHEGALTIIEAQISDLQGYLLPTDIASGTITPRADDINLSGGSDGDVLTVQADGSAAFETPAGGGGAASPLTLTSGGAAEIPLTIEAHASQSGNLTQWENAAGAVRAKVMSDGSFSNDGGQSNCEIFGSGILNPAQSSTIMGRLANGWGPTTGFGCVAIGQGAEGRGQYSVAIGVQANAFGNNQAVAIGYQAQPGFGVGYGVSLGAQSSHKLANQFVCGSSTYPINDVVFGKGYTHATPTTWTLHGTGGSGTNIAGADLDLAPGQGTGSAKGGWLNVKTAPAGSSGTSLNSLLNRVRFGPDGGLTLVELSADPPDPAEGQSVVWQSDGTGAGDDGDIMFKITAGGVTKTATLLDFSAL